MWVGYLLVLCMHFGVEIFANVVEMGFIHRTSPVMSLGGQSNAVQEMDSGLYSRQLLVLGISGQRAIRNAHVLVVGNGTLGSEVAKNLALAGVGKLTLATSGKLPSSLTCRATMGLMEYAKELNSGIEVSLVRCVVEYPVLMWASPDAVGAIRGPAAVA